MSRNLEDVLEKAIRTLDSHFVEEADRYARIEEKQDQAQRQSETLNETIKELAKNQNDTNILLTEHRMLLEKQEQNLRDHMKRTAMLEERVVPIEKHVSSVNALGKALIRIIAIAGSLAAIVKFFY